jgi:site-specific recombinase XerD
MSPAARAIAELLARAGIASASDLARVSSLLDEGIPPQVVGAIVGHQSLATTGAYAAIGKRHTTKDAVQVFGPAALRQPAIQV